LRYQLTCDGAERIENNNRPPSATEEVSQGMFQKQVAITKTRSFLTFGLYLRSQTNAQMLFIVIIT